ncbi:hypothetical protein ABMB67_003616 [Halalkalibacter oceani]
MIDKIESLKKEDYDTGLRATLENLLLLLNDKLYILEKDRA